MQLILQNFLFILELIDLQGPMNFFSGLADVVLDRFQKQNFVLNIFLKYVFKGKNIALGLKASRVFAMSIFLFNFDSFSFSIF